MVTAELEGKGSIKYLTNCTTLWFRKTNKMQSHESYNWKEKDTPFTKKLIYYFKATEIQLYKPIPNVVF